LAGLQWETYDVCENLAECLQFIDAVRQSSLSAERNHRSINFGEINDKILVCQSMLDMDFLEAA
jgi:hypothetical protein